MFVQQGKLFGSTPTLHLFFTLQSVIDVTALLNIDALVHIVFCREACDCMSFMFGNTSLDIIGDTNVQNSIRLVGHYVHIIVVHKKDSFSLPGDCHAYARNDTHPHGIAVIQTAPKCHSEEQRRLRRRNPLNRNENTVAVATDTFILAMTPLYAFPSREIATLALAMTRVFRCRTLRSDIIEQSSISLKNSPCGEFLACIKVQA